MKASSYRDRDYAFGQMMLTLRTAVGLTQVGIAAYLGVSRKAVGEWEAGLTYPTAEHLKAILALAVEQQAFPTGREAEEIRTFWHAAHQKVLLDEAWLAGLLSKAERPPAFQPAGETTGATPVFAPPAREGPRVDWGDAPAVTTFFGREWELALLTSWIIEERCRVVSVLGLGGIGKSALAIEMMHQVAERFEVVIWRSLRDVPMCETLLDDCLGVLAPQSLSDVSLSLESRLSLLLECLRSMRVLLVYDNLEAFLEEGQSSGRMRSGYEGFARLLRQIAETKHQSCLLLTSREKPIELVPLEGSRAPVRALRLARLDVEACKRLLAEKGVAGTSAELAQLIEAYAGNPLALKIVAQTIQDLFAGQIMLFLEQGAVIFGGVRDLLNEQYARLTVLERTLLCWLAIVREPVTLGELHALLVSPRPRAEVLEAVEGLLRRSLIERGHYPGSFTLQSVVLEYMTSMLVTTASQEIQQGRLSLLIQYGLEQAGAKDYVRQTQQRLLLAPLLWRLESGGHSRDKLEEQLRELLDTLRGGTEVAQGYGPANLVALLRLLRGNLRGLDLSHLVLRSAYLQGVEMQDANLAGTLMHECVLSEAFDAISAVAISPNGQYWAVASRRGEVRLWERGQILHRIWRAHTDRIRVLAFSPDGHRLITGSWDTTMKLWDVASGALLWSDWPTSNIPSVAFAPDGRLLATSGGNVVMVHLWDLQAGNRLETLSHRDPVSAIAWSPNGRLLASGDFEGHIWLWQMQQIQPATCLQTLSGHTNWVAALAFAPDSSLLASGSGDGLVKLWEVGEEGSLRFVQALAGHTDGLNRVAWSPDGSTLASGSRDMTIRLWDAKLGSTEPVLQGHTGEVYGLAFTPDSRQLLSGSDDGTLRLWDVESSQCVRIMHGYVSSLLSLDWSPDGTQLASGGTDALVTVWNVTSGRTKMLRGHRGVVSGVGWSPDGRFLASSGWDNAIRLWDPASGASVVRHPDPDHPDTVFFEMAWSPNGEQLASGTNLRGVHVWEVTTGSHRWIGRHLPTRVRHVAWSPDGTRLAGAGDDGALYVWDATDGTQKQRLLGHHGVVTSVAWSRDGKRLASSGRARDSGELFVWDAQSGERLSTLEGHQGLASAVVWSPSGKVLISGGGDGQLCWWEIHSGACLGVQVAHQGTVHALKVSPGGSMMASCGDDGAIMLWDLHSGEHFRTLRRDRPYERLTITGIKGLSEAQKSTLRALGAIESAP